MDWGKFTFALWYRLTRGMSAAEKGDYMDKTVDACVDEARGATPLADAMMDEMANFVAQRREAAQKRWGAKSHNAAHTDRMPPNATASGSDVTEMRSNAVAMRSNATEMPYIHTNNHSITQSDNQTITQDISPVNPPTAKSRESQPASRTEKTAMAKSEEANRKPSVVDTSGKHPQFSWAELANDKYGYMRGIDNVLLPEFALWYCGEQDNARARAAYSKFVRVYGAAAFRGTLERFVADCESGEEPAVRGAALMAALKRAATAAREGGVKCP